MLLTIYTKELAIICAGFFIFYHTPSFFRFGDALQNSNALVIHGTK